MKRLIRNGLRSSWLQRAVGFLAAEYLRLVWWTNRFSMDPPDIYAHVERQLPVILVFWHGQHFLTPFIKNKNTPNYRAKVLISLHRDGEFNAIAAERLGIETVRGSGDHGSAFHRKGGVGAFKEMVRALADNYNMAVTADVPKRSRVAGLGVIMLARESGRPIVPFAMATSRFIRLKNWDRTTINLPFGRGAVTAAEMISVPPDADAETMEKLRAQLEATLNEATRKAYAQLGRPQDEPGHG
ncbi:MAG TPA: lysophospholipid acyltransferase family protein [Bradyrhizobium sp.]